jgi:hypothetical protein
MPKPLFQKGQSGNPGGRPKGSISLTTVLRTRLQDETLANELVDSTISQAKAGNPVALKLLWDRIDGPVLQKVEATIDDTSGLTDEERAKRVAALMQSRRDS